MKCRYVFMLMLFFGSVSAQQDDSAGRIMYTPDFEFKDGLFIHFEQVKQNHPISKSLIISSVAYDDPEFFQKVLDSRVIQYFDELGTAQEIPVEDIWGFSQNGTLYINMNDGYYRVTIIGSICHFVASLTTYDPYYNSYYPYGSRYYSPYYPYSPYSGRTSTELRQYLLDFSTGEVMDYDVPELEILLMADPELHDEYASLRRRQKKQQKFLYIRKFNERNPLYFPTGP